MTASDHRLSVTILGSGTCVPSLERSACAVLVEAGPTRVDRADVSAAQLGSSGNLVGELELANHRPERVIFSLAGVLDQHVTIAHVEHG